MESDASRLEATSPTLPDLHSAEFVDVWDPTEYGHLEITGAYGTRTAYVANRVAQYAIDSFGAEVRRIHGSSVLSPAPAAVAQNQDEALEVIEATLRDLNRRLAALEVERLLGERPKADAPIVLVIDEFASLFDSPSTRSMNPSVPARIREYLGDLLSLGRGAGVHVILTGPTPSFAQVGHRDGIAQIVLGPMSSVTMARLTSGLYRVTELPIRPIGAGWYFRPDDHQPLPVWF